jgi:predicted GNAT family acetyltransferase
MLVSSIILGISILGIVSLLIYKERTSDDPSQPEDFELEEKLNVLKNEGLKVISKAGKYVGKNAYLAYNRGLSNVKNTRITEMIKGKGILKKKATSSDFLKDVSEYKEKVREELNGK